jgi:hypothetical protein
LLRIGVKFCLIPRGHVFCCQVYSTVMSSCLNEKQTEAREERQDRDGNRWWPEGEAERWGGWVGEVDRERKWQHT